MSRIQIYHNPRCSKSRQALTLLEESGYTPEILRYLDAPPSPEELKELCSLLGVRPLEICRTGEARFKELGLSKKDDRSVEEWCRLLSENPVLIQRPIVTDGKKAAIGRPPEKIREHWR
jgi:arsenate reductase